MIRVSTRGTGEFQRQPHGWDIILILDPSGTRRSMARMMAMARTHTHTHTHIPLVVKGTSRRRLLVTSPGVLLLGGLVPATQGSPAWASSRLDSSSGKLDEAIMLVRNARREPDVDVAMDVWTEALDVASAGVLENNESGTWLVALACEGRGLTNLRTGAFADAAVDLRLAYKNLLSAIGTSSTPPKAVDDDTLPWVRVAVCLDGLGLALMHTNEYEEAQDAFAKARAALVSHTDPRTDQPLSFLSVPVYAPAAGLRGSAPTMRQRVDLHMALVTYASGNVTKAREQLASVDLGPDPTGKGLYQFWDARAAIAAIAYDDGDVTTAERTWASLCEATPSNPPSVPQNIVRARVNATAQLMLDAEAMMTDKNCEDLNTGTYLPCDDAGIPGLAGSASPCVLYDSGEVTRRLWPAVAATAIDNVRNRS